MGGTSEQSRIQKVSWKKISAKTIKIAYEDQFWPQELRPYRDEAALSGGPPRWLVVARFE
jgi:hypothetical protein